MSNEVKTKEKVNMDPKYIIKLTVTLLLTCMVVAGVLGWVNSITKDKIAAITWEKTVTAMKEVISWQIPVAYIATVAVLTLLFPKAGSGVEYMLYSIFGGGLFLGAFFMATDYATSPVTKKGQLIYGIGCGLFTVFIRYFGSYNEGVCYSIMVMNCCTALIDKYTKPVRFGVVKSDKKEAAAK